MPSFRYQPLGSDTSAGAAVIDAPDRPAALRLLRERGITPASIEPISERQARKIERQSSATAEKPTSDHSASRGNASSAFSFGGMSRSELGAFIRELATATQAGLPLVPALQTILRSRKRPRERRVLESIIHQVEHGRSLADACAAAGKPFNDLTINLMRAGELSGRLGEVLDQAATLLERESKLRRQVLASTLYPAFLGILISIAIGVIVAVVVPRIMAPLAGRIDPSKLPTPTKIVMFVGKAFSTYWWLIFGSLALLVITVERLYRAPSSRLVIDRSLLKVPVLGRVLADVAIARFTRTLGTLINAGLPALTALRITRATLGNKAMEAVVEDVCEQVSAGKTIADPMEQSGYFPPLLTQIISLGERSGRLPQMINQAAGVFEERVESSLKAFTAVLPPLLILIAAVAIGVVMAAVLLPLLQLQELIG